MTNLCNSNLQWEVAGAKKLANKKVLSEINGNANRAMNGFSVKKDMASKIPKLETLPPLKPDNTIYDFMRESDDDENDIQVNRQAVKKTSPPKATNTSQSVSPKQTQPNRGKEPINLLEANVLLNQKKKPASSPSPKQVETELEKALSQLNVDVFERRYAELENAYPGNSALALIHLAAFLNQSLNHVGELEPSQNHENEAILYPACKLDKKFQSFLNSRIFKLKRTDSDIVFRYCFDSLFSENQKINSNHGHKIFVQLLLKHTPNLLMSELDKYVQTIVDHKHRWVKVKQALWCFAQVGYFNLANGIKIWFDGILPFVGIKNVTTYVVTYLDSIFRQHKIGAKTAKFDEQLTVNLEQYFNYYELVNDKTFVLAKDAALKFKTSFHLIRNIFMQNLSKNGAQYFDTLLTYLPLDASPKRTDFLELLVQILQSEGNSLAIWRKTFEKNFQQSLILIDFLAKNFNRTLKSVKEMRETIYYFDEQTESQMKKLTSQMASLKDTTKHHHFSRRPQKSTATLVELERLKGFNKLTKV